MMELFEVFHPEREKGAGNAGNAADTAKKPVNYLQIKQRNLQMFIIVAIVQKLETTISSQK